jgi:hypothetical protein
VWRFTYVEENGVSYARQSHDTMGYSYQPISDEEYYDADVRPNGTWHLKPVTEMYFEAMSQDYDVWYTTPRQVYDRSILVDQVVVSENETLVTVANPTGTDISGLTLFTKEPPRYCLLSNGTYYYARQGAENYQFVIPEVPAGASIVFTKTDLPTFAPTVLEDSSSAVVWGNHDQLYLRANEYGNVTLSSNLTGGVGGVMIDLGDGHEAIYSDYSPMQVAAGHVYRIYRK